MADKRRTCLMFAIGLLLSMLLSRPATAQLESDHVCFVMDNFGFVFNLESLCGSSGNTSSTTLGDRPPLFGNAGAGTVGFEARITSQSRLGEEISELPYEIVYIDGVRNPVVAEGTAFVDAPEGILLPGATVILGDVFSPDETERFTRYFVQALELRISYGGNWVQLRLAGDDRLNYRVNEYGRRTYPGFCRFPWQTDSGGRRCGDRAATVRPGGL